MRFVLVHGGFHASWCWGRTIPELERLGHCAVAVDLPGHGGRLNEESTLDNRRAAIVSVLQPGDVLVGHSGGGFDATLAADAATDLVSHIVYLAAALPREGRSYPPMARGHRRPATRRRAVDDRHIALPIPFASRGAGRVAGARHDNQTRWPA